MRVGVKVSIKELIFHEGIAILLLVQFIFEYIGREL